MGIFDWLSGGNEGGGTQTTDTSPWGPLQGPYKNIIKDVMDSYGGYNPTYGPGQYAGLLPQQQQALQQMYNMGMQGNPALPGMMDFYGDTMSSGPGAGYNFFSQMGGGQYNNPYADLYKSSFNNIDKSIGTGVDSLEKFASGGYMGANPYLDKMVNSGLSDIGRNWSESVNPSIEGMLGRSGSGGGSMEALLRARSSEGLADSMGQFENNTRGQAYESDMNRMLQASQALPGAGYTQSLANLAGLGAMTGVWEGDLGRRASGYGAQNQLDQQNWQNKYNAAGMGDDIWAAMMNGPQAALGAGTAAQQDLQNWLNEANRQHQYNQNPFIRYGAPLDILNSIGGGSSSTTTTNPSGGGSLDTTLQNLAGIGSIGSGILDWVRGR